jgi:hypothetical protein
MGQSPATRENDKMAKELAKWIAKNASFHDSNFIIIPLCCDVLCPKQFAMYRILYRYSKP